MKEHVHGLAELDFALGELPKATARNTLVRVGKKALAHTLADIQNLAPVDAASDTPERPAQSYKNSWSVGTQLNKANRRDVKRQGKNFAEVYCGTSQSSLGVELEFGTGERTQHTTGRETGSVPPQPHARPGWDRTRGLVLETVQESLGDEIEKARQRLARRAPRG